MFDPSKAKKDKEEKAARRKALANVKQWALNCIPPELQPGLLLDVKEVICGDPTCAPVDTVITIVYKDGGRGIIYYFLYYDYYYHENSNILKLIIYNKNLGMFGIPLDPIDVQPDDVTEAFPTVGKSLIIMIIIIILYLIFDIVIYIYINLSVKIIYHRCFKCLVSWRRGRLAPSSTASLPSG